MTAAHWSVRFVDSLSLPVLVLWFVCGLGTIILVAEVPFFRLAAAVSAVAVVAGGL